MTAIMQDIDACVFDAYGTLFDFAAAAACYKDDLGDKAKPLSDLWRARQLEYSWLRSEMREYVPFWQVIQEALDYTIATLGIQDEKLRQKLLDVYWELNAFPEVPDMLRALKAGGMKTAILTNGSPEMVYRAVENAGIMDLLDETFSVDMVKVYKPHPDVYQMVPDMFDVDATRVCFMYSNAWDAAAANFGFRVVWINRYSQPPEKIPETHEHMLPTLEGLPALLGL